MRRFIPITFVNTLLFATALLAADFWTEDFMKWSDKDVAKMLSDSPWAMNLTVAPRGRGGAPSMLAALAQREEFTIVWRSALPVKQAIARPLPGTAIEPQMQRYLDQEDQIYLVSISGTERSFGVLPEDPKVLMGFAGLRAKGRVEAIEPAEVQVRTEEGMVTILYGFPKTTPIVLDDQVVEFLFQMERTPAPSPVEAPAVGGRGGGRQRPTPPPEPLDLAPKFNLRKMVYNGKLEL